MLNMSPSSLLPLIKKVERGRNLLNTYEYG